MLVNSNSIIKALGAIILGGGILGFQPAYADSGHAYINNSAPKPWVVLSNGQEYTKFDHIGMVTVAGKLIYDVGSVGGVKSYWAQPKIVNGYGIATNVVGMAAVKKSKSYSFGSRPNSINKNLAFSFPAATFANAARGMCNFLASNLRNQGKSNKFIFSKDRKVSFEASLDYNVNATGAGSGSPLFQAHPRFKIPVKCAKWNGAQGTGAANQFTTATRVIKATMKHQMIVTLGGTCKVKLTTAINTNKANAEIKFRYKSQSGKQSKIITTKTAANKIAVVVHTWDIQNGPSVFDGTKIWIDGKSPKFLSNKVSAYTECRESSPSGLAPNPKKPTVAVPTGGRGKIKK